MGNCYFQRSCFREITAVILLALSGCGFIEKHRPPHIMAMPASPGNLHEPPGIPFYLPKPLLVVSKNFYHVQEPKVGLTGTAPIPGGFDQQAGYADVNVETSYVPAGMSAGGADSAVADVTETRHAIAHPPTLHASPIPSAPAKDATPNDGLGPHMFFTYEIVFVPDLSQKYVLQVNGSPGEIRAAMNLVNGWQFTGLGPYYFKDSSTAQNIMARGLAINLGLGGAGDVVNSIANLRSLGEVGVADVAALADVVAAMAEARKLNVFDVDAVPRELYRTQQVFREDGTVETVTLTPQIERYAEIYVYEANLVGHKMSWTPIANHTFDREFLGVMRQVSMPTAPPDGEAIEGAGVNEKGETQNTILNQNTDPLSILENTLFRGVSQAANQTMGLSSAGLPSPGREFLRPVGPEGPFFPNGPVRPDGFRFDSPITQDVVGHTLAPARESLKQPLFGRWFGHHRRVHENRIVDHLSSQ